MSGFFSNAKVKPCHFQLTIGFIDDFGTLKGIVFDDDHIYPPDLRIKVKHTVTYTPF